MLTSTTCVRCGATFTTTRPSVARTCRDACRMALYRARRNARHAEAEAAREEAFRLLLEHGAVIRASLDSGAEPDRALLDDLGRRMDEAADRSAALLRRP